MARKHKALPPTTREIPVWVSASGKRYDYPIQHMLVGYMFFAPVRKDRKPSQLAATIRNCIRRWQELAFEPRGVVREFHLRTISRKGVTGIAVWRVK